MKINPLLLFGAFFIGITSVIAQEKISLALENAVQLAWTKSNEASLASSKVDSKKYELQTIKNSQYPNLKLSGQYLYLPSGNINVLLNQGTNSESDSKTTPPRVNQILFGQVSATLAVFSGFKIKNNIDLYDNLYQAESANAQKTKEEIAIRVVNYYTNLYKAQKTIELLEENQKRAQQRVLDFVELEKNGIIPKNDLLKAQLQVSKIQLSIDEAKNNLNIINFYLVTLLKLNPNTKIEIKEEDLFQFKRGTIQSDTELALENRKDFQAIRLQEKASINNVKIAKSYYYPTIALLGGYAAVDVKNALEATNLINIGVGISYDLSGLITSNSIVQTAKSKAEEAKHSEKILTDYIKTQVQKASNDYILALNQDIVYDQALAQASENYRIVKDKYNNDLSDTNDLLEADVEQLSAEINKAVSKANIVQKYYELLSATGQIAQSFNLSKI